MTDDVKKGGKAKCSSLLVADSSGICAAGTLVLKQIAAWTGNNFKVQVHLTGKRSKIKFCFRGDAQRLVFSKPQNNFW